MLVLRANWKCLDFAHSHAGDSTTDDEVDDEDDHGHPSVDEGGDNDSAANRFLTLGQSLRGRSR